MGTRERSAASVALLLAVAVANGAWGCTHVGETIMPEPDAPIVREAPSGPSHAVLVSKVDAEGTAELRVRRLLVPETVEATKAAMMLLEIAPATQFGGPPHPCYDLLAVVRSGRIEADVEGHTATLSGGDGIVLRRRTPFLLRGAGEQASEILLVFVPDGMTVAACDELASSGAPVPPLPPDPAHPPLVVAHIGEALPRTVADGHATVRMLLDPDTPAGSSLAYLGTFHGDASLVVPEHVHPGAAEMLLLVSGRGEMTIGGRAIPVSAGMAIHIPPDTLHSFRAEREFEAIQVYAPPGAESRFRAATPAPAAQDAE